MAVRGKTPRPPAEKQLRGGRKDRRTARRAPAEAGRPEAPRRLSVEAAAEWEAITAELEARGQLNAQDGRLIAIYCDAFERYLAAMVELRANGPVIYSDLGGVKANPASTIADRLARLMRDILAEWGMTPLGRLRSGPVVEEAKDDLADFLAEKGTP